MEFTDLENKIYCIAYNECQIRKHKANFNRNIDCIRCKYNYALDNLVKNKVGRL